MAARVVDLSHTIRNGMRAYPGIPAPAIDAFLTHEQSRARYQGQCELTFSRVSIVAGVGTYLDSPYHRQAGLPDHATLALDRLVDLPTVVVDITHRSGRAIDSDLLGSDLPQAGALLLRSGMDADWETDRYWTDGPFLTAAAADRLVAARIAVLGADFLNVDNTGDPRRPVHTGLLRAGIPIIENLRGLGALPRTGARLHVASIPLEGVASFPIRAYAMLPP
ncbi:MAG TPA: cyclase family protein [Candidatus Limnocylindria bacterium]|nr:cyclase family protein [Candidatus Limnocylindria bacterium]